MDQRIISMKRTLPLLFPLLLLFSCGDNGDKSVSDDKGVRDTTTTIDSPQVKVDLPAIKERGKLIAITGYSSTSYFVYRGRPMGYEYELLKRLADHLGVDLEIKLARNMDQVFSMLNKGEGDIVAYGMTVTLDRKEKVDFTHYHDKVTQVLVQKRPENWRRMSMGSIDDSLVKNALGLIGKTVHVRKNSSYFERLKNLEEEIGGQINIETVPGNVSTDELIRRVATGEIEYTVADKNIAQVNKTYHPNIDIRTDISFPQRLAWAVRKNSPELLETVNDWIVQMRKKSDYYVIYNKYFKNRKLQTKRVKSELYSKSSGKISEYDHLFKEYGRKIGMDWRLLASQAYQESHFRPKVASWAGAKGLMQLMPATAKRFGASDPNDPRQSVKAGTNYLSWLEEHWKSVEDSSERIRFMLASYNVGEGHVKDAQRLAKKHGKDPKEWDVVQEFLLKKQKREYYNDPVVKYGYCRGREPVNYVREIIERFEHYSRFVPRRQEA